MYMKYMRSLKDPKELINESLYNWLNILSIIILLIHIP